MVAFGIANEEFIVVIELCCAQHGRMLESVSVGLCGDDEKSLQSRLKRWRQEVLDLAGISTGRRPSAKCLEVYYQNASSGVVVVLVRLSSLLHSYVYQTAQTYFLVFLALLEKRESDKAENSERRPSVQRGTEVVIGGYLFAPNPYLFVACPKLRVLSTQLQCHFERYLAFLTCRNTKESSENHQHISKIVTGKECNMQRIERSTRLWSGPYGMTIESW